jgi:hypothetical protein
VVGCGRGGLHCGTAPSRMPAWSGGEASRPLLCSVANGAGQWAQVTLEPLEGKRRQSRISFFGNGPSYGPKQSLGY